MAHMMHAAFPERVIHGWELDEAVVMAAEMHMGLDALKRNGSLVGKGRGETGRSQHTGPCVGPLLLAHVAVDALAQRTITNRRQGRQRKRAAVLRAIAGGECG